MKIKRAVLGADDPEMRAIEQLARADGAEVVCATCGGQRVRGETAYRVEAPTPEPSDLWVECQPADGLPAGIARADHHRPGDPGYGLPPAEFMRASSLGQVIAALAPRLKIGDGWPTPPQRMIAAADHCLAAAYAGRCPGVNPDALLHWRLTDPASPHRSEADPDRPDQRREVLVEEVLRRADRARLLLDQACGTMLLDDIMSLGECVSLTAHLRRVADEWAQEPDGPPPTWAADFDCRDLRSIDPAALVGLPIADVASRMGVAYLLHVREGGPSGPLKVVLGGCGEGSAPGVVPMDAWESWCRGQGYRGRTYGDPVRGYAGAYIE